MIRRFILQLNSRKMFYFFIYQNRNASKKLILHDWHQSFFQMISHLDFISFIFGLFYFENCSRFVQLMTHTHTHTPTFYLANSLFYKPFVLNYKYSVIYVLDHIFTLTSRLACGFTVSNNISNPNIS